MISLESKTQTTTSSLPIGLATESESETPTLSFSELLHGLGKKGDSKEVQNGLLVFALDKDIKSEESSKVSKTDTLLGLLKGDTSKDELPLELNPAVTQGLSPSELKALVKDAKKYLRNKIITSEGFKKSEIASLPKTLKGLVQVAQKFGIDTSKITLEEVVPSKKLALKSEVKIEIPKEKEIKQTISSKVEVTKPKFAKRAHQQNTTQESDIDIKLQEQVKSEVKSTPLFKAHVNTDITTEQLVQAKTTKVEIKPEKVKADETLKMLLRGEKVSKNDLGLTADFSVATARVIAPSATTDTSKKLDSLLHGESLDNSTASKLDGVNVNKADSFEVKLNEAKQMTKYLSSDVKTAIEDYKSPFTRVKVQLNPQRLGEVDLTIVQRGKNLHISLSSNNAAINALALNANDLRVQLNNNGINNASLNFNNMSQGQDGSASQQQNHQNRQQAHDEYNYFEGDETNEEIVSSLEIVVPHYA